MSLKNRRATHRFDTGQWNPVLRTNHFDAHWLTAIISPPDVCKSKEFVVLGPVIQVDIGKDFRFSEEGVGVKSEPQV